MTTDSNIGGLTRRGPALVAALAAAERTRAATATAAVAGTPAETETAMRTGTRRRLLRAPRRLLRAPRRLLRAPRLRAPAPGPAARPATRLPERTAAHPPRAEAPRRLLPDRRRARPLLLRKVRPEARPHPRARRPRAPAEARAPHRQADRPRATALAPSVPAARRAATLSRVTANRRRTATRAHPLKADLTSRPSADPATPDPL